MFNIDFIESNMKSRTRTDKVFNLHIPERKDVPMGLKTVCQTEYQLGMNLRSRQLFMESDTYLIHLQKINTGG